MIKFLYKTLMLGFSLLVLGIIGVVGLVVLGLAYYGSELPDYKQLANYEPPVVTRIYAGDGKLLTEFSTEKRVFVPIGAMPERVINAFLAAEDKNFYYHPGIDPMGVMRAVVINVKNYGQGRRLVGASTITQQVAKNFLLTSEVSYERKIKEAMLAFRIEKAFTKERILELYLNEIYLGSGTYGVAAAALKYFNKSLNDLEIEEVAYLAALPKAPNNYHPTKKYKAAIERRNWVVNRMFEDNHIEKAEADIAKEKPLIVYERSSDRYFSAAYFSEEVRRELMGLYGEDSLYEGGLLVHSTLDPKLQVIAEKSLRSGLVEYDRRHGRHSKPVAHLEDLKSWSDELAKIEKPAGTKDWKLAVVLKSESKKAIVGFIDGSRGIVTYNKAKWAQERLPNSKLKLGPPVKHVYEVLSSGDVILTEHSGETVENLPVYHYRQIPEVSGAIIAMNPHTGRILAMVGGFSYDMSEFNRATQAKRQPGSAFKPIVYLTALENGFTPATLILDAPFVMDQGAGLGKWRPSNYSGEFYGPTPLRIGIEKSRNLMTVRLANHIGMDKIADYAQRFGVVDDLPQVLSMAIGAGETTLLKMVRAYSMFVNGGKKIEPSMIDRIQDRHGKTIYAHDKRPCVGCGSLIKWEGQEVPEIPDAREPIADPRHIHQIVSIMQGVVQRGTGVRLKSLNRPLAGKTGTTNQSKDTWFIGYTPDLVVGIFVGYDEPSPMGKKETGSRVALPIFKSFMEEAMKGVTPVPFREPEGIRHVEVNRLTGTRAKPNDEDLIWEVFVKGTEPGDKPMMFNGQEIREVRDLGSSLGDGANMGTGGIY